MRLDRIKAYSIDLLVILILYVIINALIPASDNLLKYKSYERELQENFLEEKVSLSEYTSEYGKIYYKISQETKLNKIIYLVIAILYFVFLPYYFNGQTLGLYLNKLRIEKFRDGKLKLYHYLIRNIIVVGLGYTILSTILIYFLDEKSYYSVVLIISLIQIALLVLSWIMVLMKKEKRGIHEILSDTEMICLRKKKFN